MSAMVPEEIWGTGKGNHLGLLCATCLRLGILIPPAQVVITGGESLCIEHAVVGPKPNTG